MLNLNIKVNQLQNVINKQKKEIDKKTDSIKEEIKKQFQELLEKIGKLENNYSKIMNQSQEKSI